jgi:cysteine synthase
MNGMSGARSAADAVREAAAGLVPRGGGTILDAIGDTPLIIVDGIWVKLEYLNPSGSIKARIARYMIERAEREGLLRPGDTIVEASSGNTGNAMSMVAAVKGYRMLVVMPDGMSGERLAISRAFGAQVMTLGDFHVNDALAKAAELGRQPGYFTPQQFDSEWNVEENRTGSARRRWPSCRTARSRTPWSAGWAPGGPSSGWVSASASAIRRAGWSPSSRTSRAS